MRPLFLAVAALAAIPVVAVAQPAPPAAISTMPPKLFVDAGYSHPDITPGMCQTISVKEVRCTIPGMTAGPYLIAASGTSTATGAGAVQAIDIRLGNTPCSTAQSRNEGQGAKPWTSGPQTIRVGCVIQALTDEPLVIRATYADKLATPDPKGPQLSVRRLPWPGVLSQAGAGAETDQPKPAQ